MESESETDYSVIWQLESEIEFVKNSVECRARVIYAIKLSNEKQLFPQFVNLELMKKSNEQNLSYLNKKSEIIQDLMMECSDSSLWHALLDLRVRINRIFDTAVCINNDLRFMKNKNTLCKLKAIGVRTTEMLQSIKDIEQRNESVYTKPKSSQRPYLRLVRG